MKGAAFFRPRLAFSARRRAADPAPVHDQAERFRQLVLPHMDPSYFLLPAEKFESLQIPELPPRDHYAEFLDAVLARQRTPTSAGFHYAGPLTETVLLGTVAARFPKETLTWDARRMTFRDHDAANDHLRRKPRKGWKERGL